MYKKALIFAVLLSSVFVVFPTVVSAQNCNPSKDLYDKCDFNLDIRETTCGLFSATSENIFKGVAGNSDVSTFTNCAGQSRDFANRPYTGVGSQCNSTTSDTCDSIENKFAYDTDPKSFEKFARSKAAGSLLGIYYSLDNMNRYSPVPVNLALFWNDTVGDIPGVGGVFAQSVTYSQPLITQLYSAWTVLRNMAFGFMAVILLYVGFTIILRKKIDQQTVVNVQYAIPRVVLALVLIAFSYPIGGFLAGLGWTLNKSAAQIVNSAMSQALGQPANNSTTVVVGGLLTALVAVLVGVAASMGPMSLVLIIVVVAAFIVMTIILQIKIFLIYVKMLLSILTAPFEFAIGAVPGSSNAITDWFKRMLSNMASLFGVSAAFTLITNVGQLILWDSSTTANLGSVILAAFCSIIFLFYGYGFALGLPGKIESKIMGPPKKK